MSARLRGLLLAAPLIAVAVSGCGGAGGASGRQETVSIRYSRFDPGVITVAAGEPLTLRLRNDDPIGHEWIVGGEDVHARHRIGSEPSHNERPMEVTVPALSERVTTVTFDEPGEYAYICHLPGHEAYGMTGTILVE